MDRKIIIIMIQRDHFYAFVLPLDYKKLISIAYPTFARKPEKELLRFLNACGAHVFVHMSHVVPVPTWDPAGVRTL
jgi:hypothetical protein